MLMCAQWLADDFLAGHGFVFEQRDGLRFAVRDHLAYPVGGPCSCADCPPHPLIVAVPLERAA